LLDNSVILGTTDVSYGRTHQIDEFPILLAGTCNGALKTGFHYRSATNENTSHVALSLLRAMGVPAASYGAGDEVYFLPTNEYFHAVRVTAGAAPATTVSSLP
jgi:hypothetical protein